MSDETTKDAMLVISWLVGLHDEKPEDAEEQWPLAWQAARSFLRQHMAANEH